MNLLCTWRINTRRTKITRATRAKRRVTIRKTSVIIVNCVINDLQPKASFDLTFVRNNRTCRWWETAKVHLYSRTHSKWIRITLIYSQPQTVWNETFRKVIKKKEWKEQNEKFRSHHNHNPPFISSFLFFYRRVE